MHTKKNRAHGKYANKNADTQVKRIRRLFWDIETSPNVCLSWRVGFKVRLDNDNILHERSIICIGYKWEHENKPHVLVWDANQSDAEMLREFLKVANSADELVAHNGDKFDLPWFITRCAFHGIQTFPSYKTVDTLQWAKRKFYFNSNRLDYIARYLGIGGKIKTEFGLWKDVVLMKDRKALRKMSEYCARDVVLLEQVWRRLSAIVPHKTHTGVATGGEKWSCPHCASEAVHKNKTSVTAHGTVSHQMKCVCGRYFSINSKSFEKYKDSKTKH